MAHSIDRMEGTGTHSGHDARPARIVRAPGETGVAIRAVRDEHLGRSRSAASAGDPGDLFDHATTRRRYDRQWPAGESSYRVGRVSARGLLALPELRGSECFATTLTDGLLRVYPINVWEAVEARFKAVPPPLAQRYLARINYNGFTLTVIRGVVELPEMLLDRLGAGSRVVVTKRPDGSLDVSGLAVIGDLVRASMTRCP